MDWRPGGVVICLVATVVSCPGCKGDKPKPTAAPPPGVELVLVSPGTFIQGSPASEPLRRSDETQRTVTLTKSFRFGEHEVTQAEWQSVMGWGDSRFPGADHPVEHVTWFDCLRFCNALSTREGLSPVYTLRRESYNGNHLTSARVLWDEDADGYRLPTEAEWEYACRATTVTAFSSGAITASEGSSDFPDCGQDPNLDEVGWYCDNSGGTTRPVGGKAANNWGLADMHGNVQEWCWDWYDSYPASAATDPVGPAQGSYRSVRGGSWSSLASSCRAACRYRELPGGGNHAIGLRLARTVRASATK